MITVMMYGKSTVRGTRCGVLFLTLLYGILCSRTSYMLVLSTVCIVHGVRGTQHRPPWVSFVSNIQYAYLLPRTQYTLYSATFPPGVSPSTHHVLRAFFQRKEHLREGLVYEHVLTAMFLARLS